MKYKIIGPDTRYHVKQEIELRDEVNPLSVPVPPGHHLVDETGEPVKSGPSELEMYTAILNELDGVKDLVQELIDGREID